MIEAIPKKDYQPSTITIVSKLTNELNVTIKDEFTGFLPLYSYSDSSHNNGAELFVYSDLCTSINSPQTFIHCLNNETTNDISLATNDTCTTSSSMSATAT